MASPPFAVPASFLSQGASERRGILWRWRGPSGLRWVWRNGRGPHLEGRQEATHSSVLAWRIPGMGEPGGLASIGSHRVGHDCSDLAAAAAELIHFANESTLHMRWPKYWSFSFSIITSKEIPGLSRGGRTECSQYGGVIRGVESVERTPVTSFQ